MVSISRCLNERSVGVDTISQKIVGFADRLVEMTGTAGGVYLYDGDMITAVKVPAAPTINNRLIRGPWPDRVSAAARRS